MDGTLGVKSKTAWLLGCGLALVLAGGVFVLFLVMVFLGTTEDAMPLAGGVGVVNVVGSLDDSREVVAEIERHREDFRVKAVVVRIDSPGGSVAPAQEIHQAVARLKSEKPVVASLGAVAASGGYYVAVAADSIVSNPGTLTGSIGVIFSHLTVEELMHKVGVKLQVYKSGDSKDLGTFHREPTPEERALLEGVVNDAFDQFVAAVAEGRRMDIEEVMKIADGRIFTGRQALSYGLIDALGSFHDATLLAARLGGIEGKPRLVSKAKRKIRLSEFLTEEASRAARSLTPRGLEYRMP